MVLKMGTGVDTEYICEMYKYYILQQESIWKQESISQE